MFLVSIGAPSFEIDKGGSLGSYTVDIGSSSASWCSLMQGEVLGKTPNS